MTIKQFLMVSALTFTLAAPAMAQTAPATTPTTTPVISNPISTANTGSAAGNETERDVNQQDRIENGLKDGDLSTGEAAKLENGEAKIDATESKDLANGSLSPQEKAQITKMQNHESNMINRDDSNGVKGNPNSASSQRMQGDVQRDANQESRIENGIKNGSVTNKEDSRLQRGQTRSDRMEARAGANGHISGFEQRRIQRSENKRSAGIYNAKHNFRNRRG